MQQLKLGQGPIGPNEPPKSVLAEIYGMHDRGELSHEEYLDQTAIASSDIVHKQFPRKYPPMPAALSLYCEERIRGAREVSDDFSKKLNAWIRETASTTMHNTKDIEYYAWAKERAFNRGAFSACTRLQAAIDRFELINFDRKEFDNAMNAYQIDMRKRTNEAWTKGSKHGS